MQAWLCGYQRGSEDSHWRAGRGVKVRNTNSWEVLPGVCLHIVITQQNILLHLPTTNKTPNPTHNCTPHLRNHLYVQHNTSPQPLKQPLCLAKQMSCYTAIYCTSVLSCFVVYDYLSSIKGGLQWRSDDTCQMTVLWEMTVTWESAADHFVYQLVHCIVLQEGRVKCASYVLHTTVECL